MAGALNYRHSRLLTCERLPIFCESKPQTPRLAYASADNVGMSTDAHDLRPDCDGSPMA